MARAVTVAGTSSLQRASVPVSGVPLTLAAWFKADNNTVAHFPLGLFKAAPTPLSAVEAFYIAADGATGGDPVVAVTATTPSTYAVAASTAGFSVGVWSHACGVFAASNSRTAYFNGANAGTDTTNVVPAGIDRVYMGRFEYGGGFLYSDCSIAEAAIWNIALSADDVASLAKGFSPLMIRPESLAYYYPIIGRYSPEIELCEGAVATILGTADQTAHPRIIYPSPPQTALFTEPGLTSIGLFDPLLRKEAWFDQGMA